MASICPVPVNIDSAILFYDIVQLLDYIQATNKRTLPTKIGNNARPRPDKF